MSAEDCTAPEWRTQLLSRAAKRRSTFRGLTSSDTPNRFKGSSFEGRSDFDVWARMPVITYSGSPETLYNMTRLRLEFAKSECYVRGLIEAETPSVTYPTSFYVGLAVAGTAVLFSLTRK